MMAVGFPPVGNLRGTGYIPNKGNLEGDLKQCSKALLLSGV